MSPALGEEVNKDPAVHASAWPRAAKARPGPVRTPDPVRGAYITELQSGGCVWPGETTQASLNTAYIPPYHLDFHFIFKNNSFLKKLSKAETQETAPCRTGPRHHDTTHCSPQNPLGSNHPNPTGPKPGLATLSSEISSGMSIFKCSTAEPTTLCLLNKC